MDTNNLYPRFASERLKEALADTPTVLIHGPRQCGKTTLARTFAEPLGYSYFSFDDPVLSGAAESDPIGFVDDLPEKAILDEVQRVPGIFPAIKTAVDHSRISGRFLLTKSANVLPVPRLSESLSGRMGILRLHPLAQCELSGKKSSFLRKLFSGSFKTQQVERLGRRLHGLVTSGGYPPAISRPDSRRRMAWYRDYLETLTQRDVRLRRQASWYEDNIRFYHFRDNDNFEVDIVLERNAYELTGIEVKASATVGVKDFRGLRKLKDIAQKRFAGGVVFYDGTTIAGFGDNMYAVPIRLLWEKT